jgi:hypothetical protein
MAKAGRTEAAAASCNRETDARVTAAAQHRSIRERGWAAQNVAACFRHSAGR